MISAEGKKKLIKKIIDSGDKRSWYEIAADMELQIWTEKFHPNLEKLLQQRNDKRR